VASRRPPDQERRCWNWAGAIPSSSCPARISERAVRIGVEGAPSTTGRVASPPSASLCTRALRRSSARVVGHGGTPRGRPMDEATQLGPLATPDILEALDQQVRRSWRWARACSSAASGSTARQLLRAHRAGGCAEGRARVRRGAIRTVAALYARTESKRPFGWQRHRVRLGASVWTNDEGEQWRFIDEIEAGMVFINGWWSPTAACLRRRQALGEGRELGVSAPGVRECEDGSGGIVCSTPSPAPAPAAGSNLDTCRR